MGEYWKKVHDEALESMRKLTGQAVEDNIEDMERAHRYLQRRGSYEQATKATSLLIDYKWAMHEMAAHEWAVHPAVAK